MFHLVYVSSAINLFNSDELKDLLEISRRNNSALDITGMLLYRDGNFIQALEGDEQAVRALFEKISRDPRHKGIVTLVQGETPEREFPDWSMGFRNLNDPDESKLAGYS